MIKMGKKIKPGTKVKVLPSAGNYLFVKKTEDELGYATITDVLDRDAYKIEFNRRPSGSVQSHMLFRNEFEIISPAPKGWKHPNAPILRHVEQFTEDMHGSGIDYDWEIKETGTSFRASNAFHTMNEHGGYDTVVPFTVIFPKKKSMEDFTLQFESGYQHQVQKYMLREYLNDIFASHLY